jgi:hypothetical protein
MRGSSFSNWAFLSTARLLIRELYPVVFTDVQLFGTDQGRGSAPPCLDCISRLRPALLRPFLEALEIMSRFNVVP